MKQLDPNILDQDSMESNLSDSQLLSLKTLSLERVLPVDIQHAVEIAWDKKGLDEEHLERFRKQSANNLLAATFSFNGREITLIILVSIALNILSPVFLFSIYVNVQRVKFGNDRAKELWKKASLFMAVLLGIMYGFLFT